MVILNDLLLKNRMMWYLPTGDASLSLTESDLLYPAAINKNIESLGFKLSNDLSLAIARLYKSTGDQSELKNFYDLLVSTLKTMVGADVEYKPFYPNFPKQMIWMSDMELYVNAIFHYLIGYHPADDKEERPEIIGFTEEEKPLKEIRLATLEDYMDYIRSLIYSKVTLNESSMTTLHTVLFELDPKTISDLLTEPVPNKENLANLVNQLIAYVEEKQLDFGLVSSILKKSVNNAVDVLRIGSVLSGGTTSIPRRYNFIKHLPSRYRRLILSLLENCPNAKEDLYPYRRSVASLASMIHPVSYKNKYPKAYNLFAMYCKGEKCRTFNSTFEMLVKKKDITGLVQHTKNRPGLYIRRLYQFLSLAQSGQEINTILDTLNEIGESIATKPLLDTWVALRTPYRNDKRYYMTCKKANELRVIDSVKVNLPDDIKFHAIDIIQSILKRKFKTKGTLGKVYLNPELKHYSFPTVLRNIQPGDRCYAPGTRISFTMPDVIRFFLYWNTIDDLDLSCAVFGEDYNLIENISYYNLRDEALGIYHSGDITDGCYGGAEFIDIDVVKARQYGARYIMLDTRVFCDYRMFADCDKCYVGVMQRKADMDYAEDENTAQNGNIYDPSTVLVKMDLKAHTRTCNPVILDLKTSELISLGATSKPRLKYNHIGIQEDIDEYLKYILNTPFINIYEYILLHCVAREATLVDTPEEADIIFDLEQGITPYDLSILATDWL